MSRINSAIAALVMLLIVAPVFAEPHDDERYELKFGKNLSYHGGTVTIDHRIG